MRPLDGMARTAGSLQGYHSEIVEGSRESKVGKAQRRRKCQCLIVEAVVEAVEDEYAESLHSSGLRG